jgi:hypothetical protein
MLNLLLGIRMEPSMRTMPHSLRASQRLLIMRMHARSSSDCTRELIILERVLV